MTYEGLRGSLLDGTTSCSWQMAHSLSEYFSGFGGGRGMAGGGFDSVLKFRVSVAMYGLLSEMYEENRVDGLIRALVGNKLS